MLSRKIRRVTCVIGGDGTRVFGSLKIGKLPILYIENAGFLVKSAVSPSWWRQGSVSGVDPRKPPLHQERFISGVPCWCAFFRLDPDARGFVVCETVLDIIDFEPQAFADPDCFTDPWDVGEREFPLGKPEVVAYGNFDRELTNNHRIIFQNGARGDSER